MNNRNILKNKIENINYNLITKMDPKIWGPQIWRDVHGFTPDEYKLPSDQIVNNEFLTNIYTEFLSRIYDKSKNSVYPIGKYKIYNRYHNDYDNIILEGNIWYCILSFCNMYRNSTGKKLLEDVITMI